MKTRIALTLGDAAALGIYLKLIDIVHNVVLDVDVAKHLFYSDFVNNSDIWSNETFHKYAQSGQDLGVRMKNAFKTVYNSYSFGKECKVVIIGSDIPDLNSSIIEDAFQSLDKFDGVLGPTFDGGYYLLGMKKFHPSFFENIEWSTKDVCDQTINKFINQSHTYHILPTLYDIDTEDDWNRYNSKH